MNQVSFRVLLDLERVTAVTCFHLRLSGETANSIVKTFRYVCKIEKEIVSKA